ncbi:MAG TPA: nicotinate phosphoribosyltransferase, partial [Thermoanaerobaculia bacterium]|nr:nicotinate phosphoribosyltransferase [Thermoanaerobaculia bacterium]
MPVLTQLYRPSLALLTDLYELTMAYGYWRSGTHTKEAVFHHHFRRPPFGSGFTVACGLAPVIEFIEHFHFDDDDLSYLAGLQGNDGKPLFDGEFLDMLRGLRFECDVDAVPEGTVVFAHEPLIRVRGPILQAQLLETPLLTILNFQTLIATKAARVCLAAQGDTVLEFGLRRAQGIDGGLSASRAAYAGGCHGTSNVLAGKLFGIPVGGTHAHSWVLSFDTELESFEAYARAMPNNCVFLVDTYDTAEGVRHAVQVGQWLREQGREMLGVRLDSGDLAYLSKEARRILDEGGFPEAKVYASSELDEHLVESLKIQGAKIAVWGVGTNLVTAKDDPALGGVYKLTAVREPGGPWKYKVKLSEQAVKITTPGIQQVRRFSSHGEFVADMIFDEELGAPASPTIVDPGDLTRRKEIPAGTEHTDLLVPVFRQGKRVYEPPPLK